MRYVSERYERQLEDLAGMLLRPVGDAALQQTVEFEPVARDAEVIEFPHGLRLSSPPEHGWDLPPAA